MIDKKATYQNFCKDLTKRYLDELSGEGKNSNFIIGQRPTEKIAIGILDSGIQNDESTRYTSMPMIKVQFFVDSSTNGKISLNIKGNLYYNALPTFEEEKMYVDKKEEERKKQSLSEIDNEENDVFAKTVEFVPKFKKIKVDDILKDIVISKQDLIDNGIVDFSSIINKKLFDSIDLSDAIFFNNNERDLVKTAIENEKAYNDYINNHYGNND